MRVSIGKGLSATLLSHLLRYGAPLLAYPILTRSLGADGFAQFSLLLAAALILSQFIEFGFGLMGVREIAQGTPDKAKTAAAEIVIGRVITFVAVSTVYLIAVPWIPIPQLSGPMAISATLFLASAYGFSSSWYFIAVERTPLLALQDVVCAVVTLIIIAIFVRREDDGILAIMAFAVPLWLAVIYGHARAAGHLGLRLLSPQEIAAAFARSLNFFVLTGVSSIINRSSVLFLGALSSPTQVAYYAAGERLVTAAVNATLPFIRVLLPRISKLITESPIDARRLFRRAAIAIISLFSLAALAGAAMSPWAVPWFFGPEMTGAVVIVAAQMVILPPTIANRIMGMLGLIPLRQELTYRRATLAVGLLSVCALPLAAYWGGGLGVALARAASEALLAVLCAVALWRLRDAWGSQARTRVLPEFSE